MGILNVTPDSFSDGGRYFTRKRAVDHAVEMVEAGADLIDIGGESTRPGAGPVPLTEELRRVIPVVEQLAARLRVPLSVDTTRSEVALRALEAGASVINDVSGGTRDPQMFPVVAKMGAGLVIMHARGTPQTMQRAPRYHDLLAEIGRFLSRQSERAVQFGIAKERIVIDPGIGFGKTVNHNLTLLSRLGELSGLGLPILIGPSRKSFIVKVLRSAPAQEKGGREAGGAAALAIAVFQGARIVRVHDVAAAVGIVRTTEAIRKEKMPVCR
jgi:dihydropteroate synthase